MNSNVVIITGAARGIGYGIAECFAAKKAVVAMADINGEAVRKATERIK